MTFYTNLNDFEGPDVNVKSNIDEDLFPDFISETQENLEKLDNDLVAFEKNPDSKQVLVNIFRVFHSCKGMCGFMGLKKLEKLSHSGENLLEKLQKKEMLPGPEITSILLSLVDSIRVILARLEKDRNEGDDDFSDLLEKLDCLHNEKIEDEHSVNKNEELPDAAPAEDKNENFDIDEEISKLSKSAKKSFEDLLNNAVAERGYLIQEDMKNCLLKVIRKPVDQPKTIQQPAREEKIPSEPAVAKKEFNEAAAAPKNQQDSHSSHISDSNIRVNVVLLDKLVNLVGELVLVRNQFIQTVSARKDNTLQVISQRLNLITAELQEGILKTRMQPLNNICRTFPRVVRDLALSLNKKVEFEMEGEETELDKTIIEAIKDPLTHLVRNSIDHGIEEPEKRLLAGKKEAGRLMLYAFHQSGQVIIEISDDGTGIDVEVVKQKAVDKGILTLEQVQKMSEREILNIIFMPGFSTVEKVTNISGRGVGMDVVKNNIEKIGGTVDLRNRPGEGITFKIKIPLTLAIVPALIISDSGEYYAIPQVNLLEVVRLNDECAKKAIENVYGAPVYRLRGKLLPLVYLSKALNLDANENDGSVVIVVMQAGERQYGLVVNKVIDTEEIVVKPLGKHFKDIPIYAGSTIRGDGRVVLILDVLGVAQSCGIISAMHEKLFFEKQMELETKVAQTEKYVIFKTPEGGKMAIHLSKISRIEELPVGSFEHVGDYDVVQYRGQILTIINISSVLPERRRKARGETPQGECPKQIQVAVCSNNGGNVGFLIGTVEDVVEVDSLVHNVGCRKGIYGTVIVKGAVTELINVDEILKGAESSLKLNC